MCAQAGAHTDAGRKVGRARAVQQQGWSFRNGYMCKTNLAILVRKSLEKSIKQQLIDGKWGYQMLREYKFM